MGFLRLLLAVCVVVQHVPLFGHVRLMSGVAAVEMFFMISGFYMALVLDGKYGSDSWHDVSSFYIARFLRLWPLFILTTLAGYAWWGIQYAVIGREPMSAGQILEWAGPWFAAAVRFSNIFMIGQDIPSWFHVSKAGAQLTFGLPVTLADGSLWAGYAREIGQAWSIGTEIWFYLLAPFLLRARSAALAAIIAASLALRFFMESVLDLYGYFFLPAQLGLFLVGSLGYRVGKRMHFRPSKAAASTAATALLVYTVASAFGTLDIRHRWGLYPFVALGLPSIFAYTKRSSFDRTIGELSYPIYIVHSLVMHVASAVLKRVGVQVTGELLLLLVVPLSYGLNLYLERPVDAWRQALTERRKRKSNEDAPQGVAA